MSLLRSKAHLTLVAVVCGACAKPLDTSPPESRDEPYDSAGGSGAGGDASEVTGGAGSGTEQGGEAGQTGTAGAGRGGGISAGGDGGRDDSAPGGAGAGGAGDGGAGNAAAVGGTGNATGVGGEAGASADSEWPDVGTPCSVPGELACYGPDSPKRSVCRDGFWAEATPCPEGNRCDRRTGTCAMHVCAEPGESTCAGGDAQICGPDTVTLLYVPCDFDCNLDTNACHVQGINQLLIDRSSGPREEALHWPLRGIAVCFRDVEANEPNRELKEAIRKAVDTSWGRHFGVTFVGWGDCTESVEGVELTLLDECEGKLAEVPRPGFPGTGSVLSIGLCRSYFNVKGTLYPRPNTAPNLALLGYVAKHVFGHVLGLDDERYDSEWVRLMEQGLDLDQFKSIELTWPELYQLEAFYGEKPPEAWFAPSGRCLAATAGDLEGAPCDGAEAARWQLTPAGIEHIATGECLGATGSSVALGTCTGSAEDEAFRVDRVRWRASLNRCVSEVSAPGVDESPLVVEDCDPSWPADQTFRFELLEEKLVRIRTGSGACLRWPSDWTFPARPELGACDGERALFEARNGRIGTAGRCLEPISFSGLEFRACYQTPAQHFAISGAFELGGSALTLSGDFDAPELQLTPATFPPIDEQVFDYHF